jgi:hypothetical protein
LKSGRRKQAAQQAGEKSEFFAGGGSGKLPLEKLTREEKEGSRNGTQLPSKAETVVHRQSLLREHENALFALKAQFHQFTFGVGDDAVKVRLGVAVFPAAFGFGDLLVAIQNRQVITVDQEAVIASHMFRGAAEIFCVFFTYWVP